MQQTQSQFQVYSMGIAADNKHLESDVLHVNPIEVTSFGDGELDARLDNHEGSGTDKSGDSYSVKVKHTSAIEAKWLRLGHTNRRTAPDVRRGERVLLYRHSDSGEMYWDTMGMDDHLRRLETVIYSWSDIQEENKDATEPANSYSFELCTHTKQATFRTVKGDKEPFFYTFQFNTKEGVVLLTDDVGNYFELNSAKSYVKLHNKDGATMVLDRENSDTYAPNSIAIRSEKDISFQCRRFSIEAGNNINIHAQNHISEHTEHMEHHYTTFRSGDGSGNGMTVDGSNGNSHVELNNSSGTNVLLKGNKAEMSTNSHAGQTVSMEAMKDHGVFTTYGEPIDRVMDGIRDSMANSSGSGQFKGMNRLHVDGDLNLVELTNVDGCIVELKDDNIRIEAPNNLDLKSLNDTTIDVGQNLTQTVGGNFVANVTGTGNISAAGGLTLASGGTTLKINSGIQSSCDIVGVVHPECDCE
jgi:hypothetical protein